MSDQYDPMGQAMQMLQVLGQRRAQQQGNEISQQELALRAQQMAQQGDQFDRGFGLDQRRLDMQGSQFDRGQGFAEATQRYTQDRNTKMDPLAMAQQLAQTEGMQINNRQAPEMLRIQQLNAALNASQLPMRQQQFDLQNQAQEQQLKNFNREAELRELGALMEAFPSMPQVNGTYQTDPRVLAALNKLFPMPAGAQAPAQDLKRFGTPAEQAQR
jgi:hypothetical protein